MTELFDFQMHSLYSDGAHPISRNLRVAEAVGAVAVAVTDHWHREEPWLGDYLAEIEAGRRNHPHLRILAGVEGVIANLDGDVSVSEGLSPRLDYILVDLGGRTEGLSRDPAQQRPEEELVGSITRCLVRVAANPLVDAISHPLNLGVFGVSSLDAFSDTHLDQIAEAMADHGTLFDLTNVMYRWYPQLAVAEFTRQYVRVVQRFAAKGVQFALSSDAHNAGSVGHVLWCRRVLREAKLGERCLIDPLRFTSRRAR
jgi:histidinol phosphatase-like PHP family hydrolase